MNTPVRFLAAAGAALVALLYLLIARNVITVIENQAAADAAPLYIAAALFALLSVLLLARPSRSVFVAGAGLQLLVIVGYLLIAAERTPAFEAWGLGIKALQVGMLFGLVALALHRSPKPMFRPKRPTHA